MLRKRKLRIHNMINIIDNFLDEEECKKYINDINNSIDTEKQICFSNSAGSINHKYKNLDLAKLFTKKLVKKLKIMILLCQMI